MMPSSKSTSTLSLPLWIQCLELVFYTFAMGLFLVWGYVWLVTPVWKDRLFPAFWNWYWTFFIMQCALKGQYLLYPLRDYWTGANLNFLERTCMVPIHRFVAFWHHHSIHDLERIHNMKGSRLLVGYHSRNTIDLVYIIAALKAKILVSYLFFKMPIFNHLLPHVGLMSSKVDGDQKNEGSFVDALIQSDKPVILLPGGVVECLKSYEDQYSIHWKKKPGFARIIHENQKIFEEKGTLVSVVPFYTKNNERIYWMTPHWYSSSGKIGFDLYQRFKNGEILLISYLLSTLVSSLGVCVLPLPYKLDTYFGQAITLQKGETVEAFTHRITTHLEEMMEVINQENDPTLIKNKIAALDTTTPDRKLIKRSKEMQEKYIAEVNRFSWKELLHHHRSQWIPGYGLYVLSIAIYSVCQNSFFYLFFGSLIWTLFPPAVLYHVVQTIISLVKGKKASGNERKHKNQKEE